VALDALRTKGDILEGAVSFAVFVAPSMRAHVIRAITAFEVAFDYLDSIVELSNPDPVLNSNTLCQALRSAFDPGLAHIDYYEHHTARDDGGYLVALVEACRTALARLPSYAVVAEPVCHSVSRIITYQSLNHGDAFGSREAFREWALSQSVPGIDLRWWELGAAMGSQLSILALIAAAADPTTSPERAREIEHAYFPWIAALSTLLDSVVDQRIDQLDAQRSLIDYYGSPQIVAERLRSIAVEATRRTGSLIDAEDHALILAAMAAFFYSAPQPAGSEAKLAMQAVLDAVGAWATLPLFFLKVRRALASSRQAHDTQTYVTGAPDSRLN
jgi:tetraprenyl-beta-curcumene synthase